MTQPWVLLSPAQVQQLYDDGGPAASPPEGVVPNFHDPPTLYPWIIFTLTVGLTLSTSAVAVRLFTKWRLMKSIVFEDCLIVLAWITQFAEITPSLIALRKGIARHMWDLSLNQFVRASHYEPISCLSYGMIIMFIKISILLQYLRVFVPVRQMNFSLFVGCWTCIVANIVFYTTTTIMDGIHFHPLAEGPNPITAQHFYRRSVMSFEVTGWFNVVSDIVILLLPLPTIFKLRISLRKKLVIMCLFTTGILACVGSAMRIVYTLLVFESEDSSWHYGIMTLWTWSEYSVGILCFCLPVMPTFLRFLQLTLRTPMSNQIKGGTQDSCTSDSWTSEPGSLDKVKATFPATSASTLSFNQPRDLRLNSATPELVRESSVSDYDHPLQSWVDSTSNRV